MEASRRTPVVGGGDDRERDSQLGLQVLMIKTMTEIAVAHPQYKKSIITWFFAVILQ